MSRSAEAIEAGAVHIRSNNSEIVNSEQVPSLIQKKNIDCSSEKEKSLRARYLYGILFLITNLSAWFIRDYAQKFLPQLHYIEDCGAEGRDCLRTLGVLRVSLGCFIFFFLMFLSTYNTRKIYEARNNWHSGCWSLKLCLFVVSIAVPFFFPSEYIHVYGELARVGAGIFLILQLVSVIEFIAWWNKYWMPDQERKQSCFLGLFMSIIFYIASVFGIVLMYYLYAPRLACSLNIFFITWTVILLVVMMVISLHPMVNRGHLSSGIMASYIVFLCWSAIRSEPVNEICNAQKQAYGNGDWMMILGFLIAICAIVMATFSTGIDSQSFQFRKDKVQLDDDIPYKYGFFHLIFSLGAMYFAMLFISWNLENSAREWSIDVGWASTWVKIVNEWFAATVYLWKLISPTVRQPKVMDHEEPNQQIDNSTLP